MENKGAELPHPQLQPRRVKMLMVSPQAFLTLFTKGLKVRGGFKLIKGVPKDALIIGGAYEPSRQGIMLIVESSEYELVEPHVVPPTEVVDIKINDRHLKKP